MSKVKFSERGGALISRNIPGIISAIIVIAILVSLGLLLANRANQMQGETQTTSDASAEEAVGEDRAPAAEAESGAADTQSWTYDAPPPMIIDPEKRYTATITTPRGEIVIRLLPEIAPQTVNNFVFLAREDFYDGLTWHRVIEGFMAQGGDPAGDGTGGPGYTIPDEFTSEILFDRPGLVAMARPNAPDSAGSQFFITTAPAEWLNGQYTIFGEVIEGQAIVDAIPLRDPATATDPGEEIIDITITEE